MIGKRNWAEERDAIDFNNKFFLFCCDEKGREERNKKFQRFTWNERSSLGNIESSV